MANDQYPYENIEMTNVSHQREERYKQKSNFAGPKKKNRGKHSIIIKQDLDEIEGKIIENAKDKGIDPKLIFKIEYDRKISEKILKRFGCSFMGDLPTIGNAQVVFSTPERLEQFHQKWELYKDGKLTNGGNPQHLAFFNNIRRLKRLEPEDRMGPKLKKTEINKEKNYWVDIELWYRGSKTDCQEDQEDFKKIIGDAGKVTDDYIGKSIHLLRARLKGNMLLEVLKQDIVCQIEFPTELSTSTYKKLNVDIDDLTVEDVASDAAGICILDSGVISGHELIKNALVEAKKFRDDLDDETDENGHGTFDAGIAIYGDIKACIESKQFTPQARLFSARLTDKDNNLGPIDKIYIKQIRKAIIYFHDTYNCRIFNLSLGDPDRIYTGQQYQSRWAHVLDNLASERDLIIIISSGNINSKHFKEDLEIGGEEIVKQYPAYLYKEEAGLLEPATATNCITVGSLSTDIRTSRGMFDPNDKDLGVSKLIISRENQPSPFTRTGPGFNATIKPDFIAYGGNMYYDGSTRMLICNAETGIYSLNYNFINEGKLFSCDSGTSYAAPYIAHLAARIINYNKRYTSNTVRALLANAAEYQKEIKELLKNYMEESQPPLLSILNDLKKDLNSEDDNEVINIIDDVLAKGFLNTKSKNKLLKSDTVPGEIKEIIKMIPGYAAEFDNYLLRLSGYGYSDINKALASSENKVTLYAEKEVEVDNFCVFEIPIPDDFIKTPGFRKITISLAYSPPTRHTRKDYCGYSMNFELIKGKSLDDILEMASNDTKEERFAKLGAERCTFVPGKGLIDNSTLQKAVFEIKRSPEVYGDTYYLVVTCEDNWFKDSIDYISTKKEKFSVVVTLEHEKEEVQMYQEIKQRVNNCIRIEELAKARASIQN